MKVAIIQPNYIPWRGYFDIINEVDLFIIYDDVIYSKNDWRNRNKIKTSSGPSWLTVPVRYVSNSQKINETIIDYSRDWQEKHIRSIYYSYKKTLYFDMIYSQFEELIRNKHETINELNINFINLICNLTKINTKIVLSSELGIEGEKTERLISILKHVKATSYLSGPAAKDYLDTKSFKENKIQLQYKKYVYPEYPQLHGDFIDYLSILDLLFNTGEHAIKYMTSQAGSEII